MLGAHGRQRPARQGQRAHLVQREELRADPVFQVMVVVGDVVGDGRHLCLRAGMAAQLEPVERVVLGKVRRGAPDRAVVLGQPLQRLPGQVQPVEPGVAGFEQRDVLERLRVVIEPAVAAHGGVQRLLARVAEGRVAEVVSKGERLREVLVELEKPREAARDLRDLDRVGKARAEMVALVEDEHLRLVLQAPEGPAVDNAIAVALPGRARRVLRLGVSAAAGGAHRPRGWTRG